MTESTVYADKTTQGQDEAADGQNTNLKNTNGK